MLTKFVDFEFVQRVGIVSWNVVDTLSGLNVCVCGEHNEILCICEENKVQLPFFRCFQHLGLFLFYLAFNHLYSCSVFDITLCKVCKMITVRLVALNLWARDGETF